MCLATANLLTYGVHIVGLLIMIVQELRHRLPMGNLDLCDAKMDGGSHA